MSFVSGTRFPYGLEFQLQVPHFSEKPSNEGFRCAQHGLVEGDVGGRDFGARPVCFRGRQPVPGAGRPVQRGAAEAPAGRPAQRHFALRGGAAEERRPRSSLADARTQPLGERTGPGCHNRLKVFTSLIC